MRGPRPGQQNGTTSSDVRAPATHNLLASSPGIFRHIAIQATFAIALELVTFREEQFENKGAFPVWDFVKLAQHHKLARSWAIRQDPFTFG